VTSPSLQPAASPPDHEARLVDEIALALLDLAALDADDATCWQALRMAGFGNSDIGLHLDAARDLARASVAVQ